MAVCGIFFVLLRYYAFDCNGSVVALSAKCNTESSAETVAEARDALGAA